jgi:hypothetical protein
MIAVQISPPRFEPKKIYMVLRWSAGVGVNAAEVGVICHGFRGENGHCGAGKHGDLEGAAENEGGHPLGIFAAAEGVLADDVAGGRDADAEEVADAACGGVGVEGGADLGRGQGANLSSGEGIEVKGELVVAEADIPGYGLGGVVGGAPGPSLLGVGGAGEGRQQDCAEELGSGHGLRMTLGGGLSNFGGIPPGIRR